MNIIKLGIGSLELSLGRLVYEGEQGFYKGKGFEAQSIVGHF